MLRSRSAYAGLGWLSVVVMLSGCGGNPSQVGSTASPNPSASPAAESREFSQQYDHAKTVAGPAPVAAPNTAPQFASPAPGIAPTSPTASAPPSNTTLVDVENRFTVESDRHHATPPGTGTGPGQGGDKYAHLVENGFVRVDDQPLSTFSIDVDTASYSKARMYLLQQHTLPPVDAVRVEEFINYFDYDYAPPTNGDAFAIHADVATCPWQPAHQIARVALQGREIEQQRPPCNLVFLVDVSGSMASQQKIGLVKQSLQLLTWQLTERDTVAIVVYASRVGVALPATKGDRHAEILSALDQLQTGGSTNGGSGIQLAYAEAKEHFVQGGVNRVILCTDGDFNVGVTNPGDLVRMAEAEAKAGVFLTVLGFGMGNHNDALLEQISDKANGAYAFIDNQIEAKKVFIDQINGTLVTIAKDVKIQVEFNPAEVAAYRLIGYENRLLQAHEFNDDRKDAGDVGAGHTVTALYEIVPYDREGTSDITAPPVDPLKYQTRRLPTSSSDSAELFTLKLRYKEPEADRSKLLTHAVRRKNIQFSQASNDFRFAASVAAFGMLLRKSNLSGDVSLDAVLEIASAATGEDRRGYRAEFLQMVFMARTLSPQSTSSISPHVYQTIRLATPAVDPKHQANSAYAVSGLNMSSIGTAVLLFLIANLLAASGIVVVIFICVRRSPQKV